MDIYTFTAPDEFGHPLRAPLITDEMTKPRLRPIVGFCALRKKLRPIPDQSPRKHPHRIKRAALASVTMISAMFAFPIMGLT
ncbi:hypothetical protein V8J82_00675 [Gymnodinialimonas sp. 2305UL16-5]|uniref:hypothetical protein n=1 Tax=Gymnodinialimonas mytili TaxID=3126503 RepID=UPI0030ADFB23